MCSFSARKLITAKIFCLFLLPGIALAQGNESDEIRESLSQSIQKYRASGDLSEAEKLLGQAVTLDESTYGPNSRNVATDLDTLSDVLSEDKKYGQAEKTLKAALPIYEVLDGSQATRNSYYLGKLADLAIHQQRFAEAEQIYKESLAVESKEQGSEDPGTLEALAELYRITKDYPNSEAVYRKIIDSKPLGPGSGQLLGAIERLSAVYEEEGKFEQEEALYLNAVNANQKILPRGHLATIAELNDLGQFYERRERTQGAEEYYKRALAQFDGLAPEARRTDSNLAIVIENYARLLRTEGRITESEQYESRAKTIRDKPSANRLTK